MLKKCYKLFLGLLIVTGSACVSPTHASSASIIITNIRAGSQASASEEGVVLYNNSSFEINVTGWCLTNKSAVKFACFTSALPYELSIIPAYSYATAISTKMIHNENQANYSIVYEAGVGLSGSIVASADTISLVDTNNQFVDQFTWTSGISSSQQWSRTKLSLLPDLFIDTDSSIDWQKVAFSEFPLSQLEYREVEVVTPPEEPIEQPTEDPSDQPNENPDSTVQPQPLLPAIITELLPNAVGSDTGNEFIEIYNPNVQANISLNGYKLAVGPSLEKVITLTEYILKPGEYKVYTNAALGYSLLNTSSRVTLFMPAGEIASEVPAYSSPPDGESWTLIEDTWQYTSQPTPGTVNVASLFRSTKAQLQSSATSAAKPCAVNQYRSPETNRCRLISSAISTSPTPCKVGQERNPETNRCRTIKQLSTATYGVKGATAQQQGGMGWYMWAAIGGIVLLIVGYGVWEWREELKQLLNALKAKFAGKPN
jgi:hypothetical protein